MSDLTDLYAQWSQDLLQVPEDGGGDQSPALDPIVIPGHPLTCSTSTALQDATPAFSWDTNHWYRCLGVPWPYRVHKARLARYYLAVGGQQSARATWVLKQLLNPVTRRAYDLTPLGGIYENDPIVQRVRKDRISQVKMEYLQRGEDISDDDAAAQLGLDFQENVDESSGIGQDDDSAAYRPYSYWVGDMLDLPMYDDLYLDHLEVWRRLIHQTCRRVDLKIRFSLGLEAGGSVRIHQAEPEHRTKFDAANTEISPAFAIVIGMQIIPDQSQANDILITLLDEYPHLFQEYFQND